MVEKEVSYFGKIAVDYFYKMAEEDGLPASRLVRLRSQLVDLASRTLRYCKAAAASGGIVILDHCSVAEMQNVAVYTIWAEIEDVFREIPERAHRGDDKMTVIRVAGEKLRSLCKEIGPLVDPKTWRNGKWVGGPWFGSEEEGGWF